MGRFIGSGLLERGSVAVTYPAGSGDVVVIIVDSDFAATTLMAPADLDGKIIVAPIGLIAASFHRANLPTSAEACAQVFGCDVHLGADLANLILAMSANYSKGNEDASRD